MADKGSKKELPSEISLDAEKQYLKNIKSYPTCTTIIEAQNLLKQLQINLIEKELINQKILSDKLEVENRFQKYYSLYMMAPASIFIVDEHGIILECNLNAVNMIGFSQKELINKHLVELIHPSDHATYLMHKEQYFDENILKACEIRVLKNDCSEMWVKFEPLVVVDLKGKPMYGFVLNDISKRKYAEHKTELEESEKEAIINSTNDLIWSVTKDLKLITCNNAFRESTKAFSGVSYKAGDEVLLRKYFSKEILDFWEALYLRALMGENVRAEFYTPAYMSNPENWLEVNINPIYWENEITSLACFGQVTTKRKQDEQNLIYSAKMASLGEMAGGIAHEINNPLSILLGFSSKVSRLLSENPPNIGLVISDLEKIKDTTKRISNIVNGLRSFSRNSKGDPFLKTSLNTIIADTLGLCQEKFRHHGVEIKDDYISDVLFECRASQISQILLNLLNNSYDAIVGLPSKWIRIVVVKLNQERFQIKVTDSGLGIAQNVVNKIMQPFFTTKEVGKGTGLGLSISMGIALEHNGTLTIDKDSPNTTFVLELPFKQK